MLPIARMGDMTIGVCTNHRYPQTEYGYIITSQMTVIANGLPVARVCDMAITYAGCGTGIIISGSNKVFVSGLPMARMGSQFVGTYTGTVIGGAGTIFCL